jgi:hypothetical protein
MIDRETGICKECLDKESEEEELKRIIQTKLPSGIVAFWKDTPSWISKKTGQRYFKIPDGHKEDIIDNKVYQIIIREVE